MSLLGIDIGSGASRFMAFDINSRKWSDKIQLEKYKILYAKLEDFRTVQ